MVDMTKKKVLIIKPGYSETLDEDSSGIVSLGDILRSTVILNLFPPEEYEVTWVIDKKGAPLLRNNPNIARLLVINTFTPHYLLSQSYDILVNLEKDLGICSLAENIHAWERYGFRLKGGEVSAHSYSEEALLFTQDPEAKRTKDKSWSQVLFEMLGYVYTNEPYILTHNVLQEQYQVGLNYKIGAKFPAKAWSKHNWDTLEIDLSCKGYKYSWQQGDSDLETYLDWISSCGTIVTQDSLGLHVALAMGKKVVALFGPTLASEVDDYPNLIKIVSETGNVQDITVEEVMKAVESLKC